MIGKRFCPNCGSDNVEMVAGGMTGSFMCNDCGFSGSVFPERPIVGRKGIDNEDEEVVEEILGRKIGAVKVKLKSNKNEMKIIKKKKGVKKRK